MSRDVRRAAPAALLVAALLALTACRRGPGPLPAARSALVPFAASAFPYRGAVPPLERPFLDVERDGRRGHDSPRGGIYWEDPTYSDRRVLLDLPRGFDPARPLLLVVFFHGNQATLERDVRDRQQVPRQVEESGKNIALIAPQLAVDALDSSAGHFWEKGFLARFLAEAAHELAGLYGDARSERRFAAAPVVLVAYSGGYLPAAYALDQGGADPRVRGVVLLDSLYDETDKFGDWILRRRRSAFFFSAYTEGARPENRALQDMLALGGAPFATAPPRRLAPGSATFLALGADVVHDDFLSRAWTVDPLKNLLAAIDGYGRD